VRYSGSIIPLSFSEIQDRKSVQILNFEGKQLANIQEVKIPRFRELVSFSGDLESIKGKLKRFDEKRKGKLIPWIDIQLEMEEYIPNIDGEIRTFAKDFWMEILKIRSKRSKVALESLANNISLDELTPEEVFVKKCTSSGEIKEEELNDLKLTFRDLRTWMLEE
jgi:exonuclease SbcD